MSIYLSHCIRGAKGIDATEEDMRLNCQAALRYAKCLRVLCPYWDIYVPAEHEDFVGIAYRKKLLTEAQILAVDCDIVGQCDVLVAYNPECISRGMQVEIDYAEEHGIPVIFTHEQGVQIWPKS